MKFDRHISSSAAEVPIKFQSDRTILNTSYPILKRGPGRYTIQSSPKLDVKWPVSALLATPYGQSTNLLTHHVLKNVKW